MQHDATETGSDSAQTKESQATTGILEIDAAPGTFVPEVVVPPRGVEHKHDSPRKTHGDPQSGTPCGTPHADSALSDPDLQTIITAWPTLPESTKAKIMVAIRKAAE